MILVLYSWFVVWCDGEDSVWREGGRWCGDGDCWGQIVVIVRCEVR